LCLIAQLGDERLNASGENIPPFISHSVEGHDRGNRKHTWLVKIVLPSHGISCEEHGHQVADNLIPCLGGIYPSSLPKIVATVVTVMAL